MSWENFWPSFTSSLLSGSTIALIFGIFLAWLIRWSKRPLLKLILCKENSHQSSFNIRNNGRSVMRKDEVNWHIFFPKECDVKFLDTSRYPFDKAGELEIGGVNYIHYRDYNKLPLFPKREIKILEFKFNSLPQRSLGIYYFFATAIGPQPYRVWYRFWFRKIQDKTGNLRCDLLPQLQVVEKSKN